MDASQILNQNLAPMLDAIRSYGQQIAKDRDVQEQRAYQAGLRREERQYQENRTADERNYQERLRGKIRSENAEEEQKKRRLELTRTINRAFPSEDVSKLTDAQLEARAIAATQKINKEETFAKSDNDLRAEGIRMGIPNADEMEISALRKAVVEKKNSEAINAEQEKFKAAEVFQSQRLATPEGQASLEQYKKLADKKAELISKMATLSYVPDDAPVDIKAVGARMIELMSNPDPTMAGDDSEIGPAIYAKLTDPRNKDLKRLVLDPIMNGQRPSPQAIEMIPGISPRDKAYLNGLNARAIAEVNRHDPKVMMAEAALGRNSVYGQKYFIGESLRQLDSEMRGMVQEYPALRKIPSINMDAIMNPTVKPAPGTEKPGIPALPAVSPKGAMMTPAVPAGPKPISGVSVNVPPAAAMSAAWSGQGGVRPSVEMPASAMLASAPAPAIPQPEDSTFVPSLWRGWTDPRNTPLGQIPLYPSMETMQSIGQSVRNLIGPYGEMISGASDRYAMPVPSRLTNAEMLYNPEGYKAFLRSQMGGY